MLPADQTAAVAPSAGLVAWSRLGPAFDPAELDDALERRSLVELWGMIRPAEDVALYRAEMAEWPGREPLREWQAYARDWVAANDACRRDILIRLAGSGPLSAREIPDSCAVGWESTGWNNNRNVVKMFEFMAARGEIATAGHRGNERLWDLAERVYPDAPVVPAGEALRVRNERRLTALGIARQRTTRPPGEPNDVGETGEPAVVEGVKGTWRVDPALLGRPFSGRAALLSPFDRLVVDRKRTDELLQFDYQLEMYKPAAKRRFGYFALPILYGDRLVGKLDAYSDRRAGVLRVYAIHEDEKFTSDMADAVRAEIASLGDWLGLETSLPV